MTHTRFLPWVFLAAALFVGPASAQLDPVLTLTPDKTSVSLGPNDTAAIRWTATNGGNTQATVTLSLASVPGWSTTFSSADQSFALPAGQSRVISVPVHPIAASNPAAAANLVLTGRITDAAGRTADQTSSVALNYVAPVLPPSLPPPVPDHTLAWALGTVAVVLLAGLGAYVYQARQVHLAVDAPSQRINAGTDGWYGVAVANPAKSPRNMHLRVGRLPEKWVAAFSFPSVRLAPGESVNVPLYVKVPVEAKPEDVPIQISARPNPYSPWLVASRLTVQVVDVGGPGPSRPY